MVITRLDAKIMDKIVSTQVIEKEDAKEKYDDAVAGGKVAVLATKEEHNRQL